ncbi:fimbrillin family protein [uncultured Parabacteroides sp.]|uniref:fimbrillin family protein n=7 Tax=uncultured Parabacteroides sp. TaxID=512312 RepID=UPI00265B55B6|nr:fimbrillin family protein [uncultured Parabacteroides sp.]
MKHLILYPLMGLALCMGCTANLPGEDGTSLHLLSVTLPDDERTTKAAVSTISDVNVYLTKKSDGSDYVADNKSFMKFSNASGSWTPDHEVELTTTSAYVYGCYPKDNTITNDGVMPKISVTLLDSDDFSGTGQSDYLYATTSKGAVAEASSTARSVSLQMNHALAKISFRVSKASGVTEKMTLTAIDIVSRNSRLLKGDGTMLLNDGTLNAPQTDSLHLKGSIELAVSQTAANVNCLAAPMKGAEPSLSFSLHVKVGDVERVFTTAPVSASVHWEKGKQYTYAIQINKMSGTLTDVSINTWQTDASPNTSIGI